MKPQQAQCLRDILFIVGFAVMTAAYLFGEVFIFIGAGIMLLGLIPHFLYNKCPHCGHQLRPWSHEAPYCPFCGQRIDGWDK